MMRRTALAVAAFLLAASPVFAAGAYVTRTVQDGSGTHVQSYWDESGAGTGPFDPVYQMPNGYAAGSGSGSSSISNTGFAAYGPDAVGGAPSKPPVLLGLLDGSGNVRQLSPTYPAPTADSVADAGIGTPADAAAAVGGNGSTIAQLKQAVSQLSSAVTKLTSIVTNQNATAPGTSASNAQGFQGVAGGVPAPISLTDGADTTLGSKADAANAATGSSLMAIERQLHADLLAATPPGTNNIGSVTSIPSTGATMTTSQPQVTTTAAALTFSGSVRRTIYNPASNTASIFIGNSSSVTTSTGWEIPPGATDDLSRFSGTVYAIAASTQTVRLISY